MSKEEKFEFCWNELMTLNAKEDVEDRYQSPEESEDLLSIILKS
jgi:hypothetical protein